MNAKNDNQTDSQDTVEQDQNTGSPCPAAADQSAPTTNPSAPTDPSDSVTSSPITGPEPITDDSSPTTPTTPEPTDQSAPSANQSEPQTQAMDSCQHQEPLNPLDVLPRRRGRPCKVAQLPPEMREFVNEQLLLGTSYRHIADLLDERGHPGFSYSNIGRWTQGGYKTWAFLKADQFTQNARREAALKETIEKGYPLKEAAMNMALSAVCEVVADLDVQKLQTQLSSHPGHFVGLFNGLSRYVAKCHAMDRNKNMPRIMHNGANRSDNFEAESKGGLTTEQRDAVRRSIGLRPPPTNLDADMPKAEEASTPPVTEPTP